MPLMDVEKTICSVNGFAAQQQWQLTDRSHRG